MEIRRGVTERDPLELLATITQGLRVAAFVLVAVITLTRSKGAATGFVEVGVCAVALSTWLAGPRIPPPWRDGALVTSLMTLSAIGDFAVTSHQQQSMVAVAIMAQLVAGAEFATGAMLAVAATGVLGVEIGALHYGGAGVGTVLGFPALVAGAVFLGRYRRSYATQAAQAQALLAETRRAQAEAERAAALTERSRIAREIHDVLAHSLGALGVQLQAAEAVLTERGDIEQALKALGSARRLVDEGLLETRRAVHALRTDAPPLPTALAALVAAAPNPTAESRSPDTPSTLTVDGDPYALSPAAGLALLRTAQEAVVNARKHAGGHPARITLRYDEDGVDLKVSSLLEADVTGRSSDTAGGYGLAGMHERLLLIDGELTAGPADGRWVVHAWVPRDAGSRQG